MERLTLHRNSDGSVSQPTDLNWNDVLSKLTDYEDAEEQGRLYRFPCKPGDTVWVVERDENGTACEVSGYVFLAAVCDYAFCSPAINGNDMPQLILKTFARETAREYSATGIAVFSAKDCYATQKEANIAIDKENC